MEKITYTWEQFDKDCEKIANWAKGHNFTGVFGIPRNGMIIAIRLSHLLDIPFIDDLHEIDSKDTLVVDDTIRTGETKSILEDHIGDVVFASIVWSGNGDAPDFFCTKTKNEVIFPWENKSNLLNVHPTANSIAVATRANLGGSIRVGKKGIA